MGIKVTWFNEQKTILYFQYTSPWTWEEFHRTVTEANLLIDEVTHPVHHLYDMTASSFLPQSGIAHLKGLRHRAHPRLGKKALIARSGFLTAFTTLFQRLYPGLAKNFMVVPDLQQALAYLQASTSSALGTVP